MIEGSFVTGFSFGCVVGWPVISLWAGFFFGMPLGSVWKDATKTDTTDPKDSRTRFLGESATVGPIDTGKECVPLSLGETIGLDDGNAVG